MKILTAAEMREVDCRTTATLGIPSLQLMENAGKQVVEILQAELPGLATRRIVVLCGKGNNGGDGLVVARLLKQQGCAPVVYLFSSPVEMKGDAAENLKRWEAQGGKATVIKNSTEWEAARVALAEAQVLIDALLGTGMEGPIKGFLSTVIEDVNRLCRYATVVAVDTPSGLPSDANQSAGEVVRADYTVTFTAPKVGQLVSPASERVGKLIVRDIGTTRDLIESTSESKLRWIERGEFQSLPWKRKPDAHKGDFGHALIVAGSVGKSGAAALSAWGALRAGAGLVTVATASEVLPIVASTLPEIMTEPLLCTDAGSISARNLEYGRFSQVTKGKSVMAIGPGLSTDEETQRFVRSVLAETDLPVILDADGLNAFAGRANELSQRTNRHLALTPHPGEMARLVGRTVAEVQENRMHSALDAASRWNVIVVLKGHHTIVATPDGRAFFNSTGNPGMATGGTGDVLTGILAGLTAQFGTEEWERVLALGVHLHGLAGDLAAAEVGEASMIASDLLRSVPRAYRQICAEALGD